MFGDTHTHVHHHYAAPGLTQEQFLFITQKLENIMSATQDLDDKITALETAVNEKQAQLEAANAALQTQLSVLTEAKAALEAELANSVNAEATQAAIARIDAVIADVASTPA